MSNWDNIHIRQRIELTIKTPRQAYTFGSIIVRKSDSEIYFRMPASPHSTTVIRKGTPAEVAIYTEGRVLKFSTEIGMIQPVEPPSVQILRPADEKIQSGDMGTFYELQVELPVRYRFMRDSITPISEYKKGVTNTLSADDCVIQTDKSLTPDGFIELNLTFPGEEEVSFIGKISSSEQMQNKMPPVFVSHIKYEVIRKGEQDKIMKFVFARQRSLRKKGMF